MPGQRLKGQEFSLFMNQSGVGVLSQFDSIQDFEMTLMLATLEEGYLGETVNRFDDVFTGIDGKFSATLTQGAVFDTFQAIINRARRGTPGVVFNLKGTLQFPSGERRRCIIDNAFFGAIPIAVPKRDQYVGVKVPFKSSSGRFI